MANKISYGPHLFPGIPEFYIRTNSSKVGIDHRNIIQTLAAAFSDKGEDTILSQLAKKFYFDSNGDVNLSFMNYGDMQMVYLATINNKLKFAVLINQPHTPLDRVKEEFDNLERLVEIDPKFVVKPLAHFALKKKGHELYASEYIDNAICVAVYNGRGMYDPLPSYHFKEFTPEMSREVNSNMIALLVNYYDIERERGLAKTQISGNDFILTRDFKKGDPRTVRRNMKIISARGFIEASFNKYLDMLRREFLTGTYKDDTDVVNGKIQINTSSKLPMTIGEIERGIEIGLGLREN